MKSTIQVLGAIVLVCALVAIGFFAGQRDITDMMGIPADRLHDAHAQCQLQSGERCRAYGGFAPESMFQRQSGTPRADTI